MKKWIAALALVGCMLVNVGCFATDFDSIVPENLTHEELLQAYNELKSAYDALKGTPSASESLTLGGYVVGEDALTEGKYNIIAKDGFTSVLIYDSYADYAEEKYSWKEMLSLATQSMLDEYKEMFGENSISSYSIDAKNIRISNGNYIYIESGEAEFIKLD